MTILSRRREPDVASLAIAAIIFALGVALVVGQCTRPDPHHEAYGPYYISDTTEAAQWTP